MGRKVGVTEVQLYDLARYQESPAFSVLERLVIEYSEAMTQTPVEVSEALFAALRQSFTEAQLVELTAVIAWENYRARFAHALGIEAQGFSAGAFCVVAERPLEASAMNGQNLGSTTAGGHDRVAR